MKLKMNRMNAHSGEYTCHEKKAVNKSIERSDSCL